MSVFIHPSAIVDSGAIIGEETKIWHWVHVSAKAEIGERCVLGQNVFIANRVKIGNGVKIQNNVSVYEGVILEDEVFCGPSMVFTNVHHPRAAIERKHEFRPTLVRQGATLGANCTILCGVEIGEYALIGAGCVITKSVPAFALMVGVPGQQIGWVSRTGATLALSLFGEGQAQCPETGEWYRVSNGYCQLAGQEV